MMKKTLPLFAFGFAACASSVLAEQPAPSMKFLSIPSAQEQVTSEPELVKYRSADQMVVIYRQPSDCGVRPVNPRFDVNSGALHLGYDLPSNEAAAATGKCKATGIFAFKNLPHGDLQVVADARPIPALPQSVVGNGPTMTFTSVPAIARSSAGSPGVTHFRHLGQMVVIAKQAAQCGQRPTDPSMNLNSGTLKLGYGVAGGETSQQGCVATGIFTVKGLPDEALTVAADSHPVAAAVEQAPAPGPIMTFLSVPAIAVAESAQPMLVQSKHGDEVIAIVTQRAECGQRPTDPWFDVTGGIVNVGFRLATGNHCMAIGIFTLKRLPSRDLIVSTYLNGEPLQVRPD